MESILVYTVHKAASTFLNLLLRQITRRYGIAHYSQNDETYHDAIQSQGWSRFIDRHQANPACFGPIRGGHSKELFPENLSDYSIVLHLRDPRDVLTSMYYSYAYSHCVQPGRFEPASGQREKWRDEGVDRFVLRSAAGVQRIYEHLCEHLLGRQNVNVVRYEDMVTDYEQWLPGFLGSFRHLPIPHRKKRHLILPQSVRQFRMRQQLYQRHKDAFSVASEDKLNHKRKVTPGDYLDKLQPETVDYLNTKLASLLATLGYHATIGKSAA